MSDHPTGHLTDLRNATDQVLSLFSQQMSLEEMAFPSQSVDEHLKKLIAMTNVCKNRLENEFWYHGPLQEILCDTSVTEIIINGHRQIWFERNNQWQRHQDEFLSLVTFKNWVHRLSTDSGMLLDLNNAFANGRWRDFRVHLACAPLVQCEFHISLRRHSASPWTLLRLQELAWATDLQFLELKNIVQQKSNILFVGPTGCGKTSVLSACLNSLPENERVVIIEDTDELPLPNPCSTKLLAREGTQGNLQTFNLTDLVKQSLRMRPERLTIGEVRGGEAKDLMLALATGHRGSFGTLHAEDARQALLRLEMLVQIGAPQWSTNTIRQLISLSINHVVVCGFSRGQRSLLGIYKLASLESCGFLLEPIGI